MLPKFFDTDQHLSEPPDFWTGRFPKQFEERAPKWINHPTMGPGWSWDGGRSCRPMGVQSVGSEDPRKIGNNKTFEDIDPGCYDAKKRIEAMDIDGARACLLFQSGAGFFHLLPDDDVYVECARAYNDAVMDWAQAGDAERIIPAALIPHNTVEAATAELNRVAKLGFKHFQANRWPSNAIAPSPADDAYWATIQDLGLVMSVHGFGGGRQRPAKNTPAIQQSAPGKGHAQIGGATQELVAALRGAGLNSTPPLATFIYSGILERFPKLKLALIETSVGWLPYLANQMDALWLQQRWLRPELKLSKLPSDYLHQIYANFDREWLGVKYRHEHIGPGHVLFGTDYPHIGNFYPHSRFYLELVFQGVPEQEQEQMLWSNAATLYGVAA